jgi:hypothetical protein
VEPGSGKDHLLRTKHEDCDMRNALRIVLSGAAVLVALVLAVAPVAADTELGHSGQVGQHSLRDADVDHPGASCRYKTLESGPRGYENLLKRIDVRPPRMRSVGPSQRVGWRFIVQRSPAFEEEVWTTTYKSPIQKATAYAGVNASFDPMSVPVAVPADSYNDPLYRVHVTMFWYASDGTVLGRARHGVDYLSIIVDGHARYGESDYCVGHPAVHGDGP